MNNRRKSNRSTNRKKSARWPWAALVIAVAVFAGTMLWLDESAVSDTADVVVYKTASCSCCHKWVEHLREHDLDVAVVNVRSTQPVQSRVGVPRELGSCHTAKVGNYWVEGHVPADLIQRLMTEQPSDIAGIAVPGMPIGSPGMEGPNPVEYDVLAYDINGVTQVYATREGFTEPQSFSTSRAQ